MEKIKALELFLGEYSNTINLIVTMITIIALIISIKSLEESKKSYTLSANGARLDMKFLCPPLEYTEDAHIYKSGDSINVRLYNEFAFETDTYYPIRKLYVPDTVFLCISPEMTHNIVLKNIGFIMSKNIHIRVRFEKIIMTIKDKYLDENNMCNDGWIYDNPCFEGYRVDHIDEVDYSSKHDVYLQKTWKSKDHDINIYPGQEETISIFNYEELYMYGDEGKMIITIVGDQSEFIEKEYIIKINDDYYNTYENKESLFKLLD